MVVIVSKKKKVGDYLTACIIQLHENGEVEVEATGGAIEKLVRTVSRLLNVLAETKVENIEFQEVDFEGKKKAKMRVRVVVLQQPE